MKTKSFVPNNNRFKILTDTGFSDFIGVTKSESKFNMIEITTSSSCCATTEDHEIFTSLESSCKAVALKLDDHILTDEGIQSVTSIKKYTTNCVYDILHVYSNNRFYSKFKDAKSLILKKNCLYLDELGFLNNAEEFYESVYPTITSGKNTKVIITSTPKGLNYFYKMWMDAENGRSDYVAYDVKWYENPTRDQDWYDTQCKNMNAKSIEQEMNCVGYDTEIVVNGSAISIGELHDRYSIKNGLSNTIAYITDIEIV